VAFAVVAIGGCNGVFGLAKTDPADALVIDAPPPTMSLTWRQLTSTPFDTITFPPIAGVVVSVGAFDGQLASVALRGDGSFDLPYHLTDHPYRVVYQLPGDPVIHELQWQAPSGARFAVPLFGSQSRQAPPAGCGYALKLAAPGAWGCVGNPCRMPFDAFITGVWAQGIGSYDPVGTSAFFGPIGMQSLSGALDTPQKARGDLGVAVRFSSQIKPRQALDYVETSVDMVANMSTVAPVTIGSVLTQFTYRSDDTPNNTRIAVALASLPATANPPDLAGGIIPSVAMPSMTRASANGGFDDSVLFILNDNAETPLSTGGNVVQFANPFTDIDPMNPQVTQPDRPAVLRYTLSAQRTLAGSGPTLRSGLQTVTTDRESVIPFNVGLPTTVSFTKLLNNDNTPVTLPTDPFVDLKFTIESPPAGTMFTTTDCVITTYAVGAVLSAVRTITVPIATPQVVVHVPTADFLHGSTYAFGIACRNTYPAAANGDYTILAGYPLSESQLFPGTITIQ
jgi:hypothetical protein